MLKAKENKWVLRRALKTDKEGAILSCTGKLFHNRGPTTEKARSPLRFSLEQGMVNKLR